MLVPKRLFLWAWAGLLFVLSACGKAEPCRLNPEIDQTTCSTLLAMALPATFPADPTNRYIDDPDAAVLGYQIAFDQSLSANHTMSCATCHEPAFYFTEPQPTATAIGTLTRNAPTAINAAWTKTIFWDGRVDVLWAQPIASFENPLELGFTRLELAHAIANGYADKYEAIFGVLPPLSDMTRFPPAGAPGDAAFDDMSSADQIAINRIAANVGKAIGAYLRKVAAQRSPFDRYLAGEAGAITPNQELGMLLFVQNGCADCHNGPQLSDQEFHNLGVGALPNMTPDRGRADGIVLEQNAMFSAASIYSDAQAPPPRLVVKASDLGAMRTPSLRNVALTPPYMHNGSLATLADVLTFHLQGGGNSDYVGSIDPLLVPRSLSPDDQAALLDFLSTLTGAYAPAPWSTWPVTP
jgi:cytochrome c peroxidase